MNIIQTSHFIKGKIGREEMRKRRKMSSPWKAGDDGKETADIAKYSWVKMVYIVRLKINNK